MPVTHVWHGPNRPRRGTPEFYVSVLAPNWEFRVKHMTEKPRDAKIDIHHLYASAALEQTRCVVMFSSSDNQKAVIVLNHGDR